MHKPRNYDLNIALRYLRYLKSSTGKGVYICKSGQFSLIGYVDADWVKCLNTRKSVTGYLVYLGNSLIS